MSEAKVGSRRQMVFLVVVDDEPEMQLALRYAARRAVHVGGRVVLLHVVAPTERQHSLALESLMREERLAEAGQLMEVISAETAALTGVPPSLYIREGQHRDEVIRLIDEDQSISVLVLGAGAGENGPGPLVMALSTKDIARLRVPVTIVPGTLTLDDLDALS